MNLFNLQGELLKSFQTKYGNNPRDIAVTSSGDLVYTAHGERTVNIVNNQQIQEVIRVKGWKALCVCSTSSDDLLVTMISDDEKESKRISTEKQSIQFDDNGKPLFYRVTVNTSVRKGTWISVWLTIQAKQ
ncbi:uncharacterized protein LOC134281998 [Saccostrea cucullata]|uniref:uncharacterized protein LOC134281998 n=1 Tax=Saccostrea cuccullata TaxID=36930 RepID=UPI002ED5FF3B